MEFIAGIDGIDAFDDSKGTNVGATVAAINGLGADNAPAKLVVILGGDGKGQDFAPLAEPVRCHARAVATLGRDAALIEQALSDTGVAAQRHDTLPAATRWAFTQAERRRRGAAEPGVREPRHVPQLRTPRRGVRCRGASDRGRARGGGGMSSRSSRPMNVLHGVDFANLGARFVALLTRRGEAVPMRDWTSSTSSRPQQAAGFDQPLLWVVSACSRSAS